MGDIISEKAHIDKGADTYFSIAEARKLMNTTPMRSVRSALNTAITQHEIGGAESARSILNSHIIDMLGWSTEKAHGGPVKKKRGSYMGGGKVHRKKYAKGGGVRKATRYK